MIKYGYGNGSLFSWDRDFHFEGNGMQAPEEAFISENRVEDEMLGAALMSGWTGTFIVIHSDGISEHTCLMGFDVKVGYWIGKDIPEEQLKRASKSLPICICGPIVSSPERMVKKCEQHPTSRVYACPIVDELSALGVLVRHADVKRPYRVQLFWQNTESIDAEYNEFDPALDGDGYGRMADLVTHGLFPVNEMMWTVGISPFYGKVLHRDWLPESQMIVRRVDVDRLFPSVPVSAKNYAATSVPVMMETTRQFRAETGYNGPFVNVFVSTDYVPGVSVFMRFYKTLSNKGYVYASGLGRMKSNCIPVFRSNRAYRAKVAEGRFSAVAAVASIPLAGRVLALGSIPMGNIPMLAGFQLHGFQRFQGFQEGFRVIQ
jgi:hypothetical protein